MDHESNDEYESNNGYESNDGSSIALNLVAIQTTISI